MKEKGWGFNLPNIYILKSRLDMIHILNDKAFTDSTVLNTGI